MILIAIFDEYGDEYPLEAGMTARLIHCDQEFEVKHGMTVRDALSHNDISPGSVLATREGELITDDEIIQDEDTITLIAVISGGMH